MRYLILLFTLLLCLPALARDVYKWTSEDGVIHYADTYQPGSVRVKVPDERGSSRSPVAVEDQATEETGQPDEADYLSFDIIQPEQDATVRSNEGLVDVILKLTPTLQSSHAIRIFVDGKDEGELKSTQFSLNELNRGTHSLQASVVDAQGATLISSSTVTFHLRKASIIKP